MREVEPLRLAELTTLRTGGAPERMFDATTTEGLVEALRETWERGDPWLVLGGGSNLFVGDEPFDGTVIRVRTTGIEELPSPHAGRIRLRVQAGHGWDDLVAYAVEHGYAGLEAMSGIPGTVGASPVQNIGAYGQEIESSLVDVEFLDYESGEVRTLTKAELGLGYRMSVLKGGLQGIVLSVDLELADNTVPGGVGAPLSAPVAYAQLADALGVGLGSRVSIAELRRTVLGLRSSKGMVLDPADPDSVSAGSFFTNPIVSESFARSLPSSAPRWPVTPPEPDAVISIPPGGVHPLDIPPLADGPYDVKLSAAWLIENAGIRRGFGLPGSGAAISSKHTLAIVNRGGATAQDVAQLASFIQARVQSDFGVLLRPEPVLVGVVL